MPKFTDKQKLEILTRANKRALDIMKASGSFQRFNSALETIIDKAIDDAKAQRKAIRDRVGWTIV